MGCMEKRREKKTSSGFSDLKKAFSDFCFKIDVVYFYDQNLK